MPSRDSTNKVSSSVNRITGATMRNSLSLILKNAARNKRRSFLTAASMATSLCVLGLIFALYQVLFIGGEETPATALRLIVHHKVSLTQELPAVVSKKRFARFRVSKRLLVCAGLAEPIRTPAIRRIILRSSQSNRNLFSWSIPRFICPPGAAGVPDPEDCSHRNTRPCRKAALAAWRAESLS